MGRGVQRSSVARRGSRGALVLLALLLAGAGALLLALAGGGRGRAVLRAPQATEAGAPPPGEAGWRSAPPGPAREAAAAPTLAPGNAVAHGLPRRAPWAVERQGAREALTRADGGPDERPADPAARATLTLELVDAADDAPVFQALVRDPNDPSSPRARSGRDGLLRLRFSGAGVEQLAVSHPRFVDRTVTLPRHAGELRVELTRSADLTLRWDAQESGPGEVWLWSTPSADRADWSLARPAWQGEGQARFEDLDPSTYLALGDFELGVGDGPSSVALSPGVQVESELRILPPASIVGRALFADGSPIGDAEVRALPLDGRLPTVVRERLARSARTDLAGRFELNGLGRGLHRLRLSGAEGSTAMLEVELAGSGGAAPVELVCPTPLRLRGTVTDVRGAALQGAAIAPVSTPAASAGAHASGAHLKGAAISAAGGSFDLRVPGGVPSGFLVVTPPPGREDLSPATVAWSDEHAHGQASLTVRLEAMREIEGEIRDAGSHALIPGASIEARFQPGTRAQVLSSAEADADGRFVLSRLPALPLVLLVRAPGYRTERLVVGGVDVQAWPTGPLRIKLSPAAPLALSLLEETGDAAAGVDLCVLALGDPGARWWARTDERGRAEFESLPLGRLRLELGGARWEWVGPPPGAFEHSGPDDRVLEVRPRRRPKGAVLEARVVGSDGSAVRGLQVQGAEGALVMREGDRVRVEGLDPEIGELWISGSEHAATRVALPELVVGRVESLGRIELPPTFEVRVEVLRRDGGAVPGAQVRLLGAEVSVGGLGRELPPLVLEERGAGQHLGRAQRGTWRLQVRGPGILAPIQIVRVDPSATGEALERAVVVDG